MMEPDAERAVEARASTQLGLVTRSQAVALGFSRDRINRRLRTGEWKAIHRGVYALAGSPPTWERKVLAGVLAAGRGALASHATGLMLHGLDGSFSGRVAVTVEDTTARFIQRVVVHRSLVFECDDRASVGAIPVTSVARTLADCSGQLSLGQLARCLDDALVRNLVTHAAVASVATRLGPAPGRRISQLRLLVAERGPEADLAGSRPEMRMFRVLREAGLPEAVAQHRVVTKGEKFFIDVSYPERLIAMEYQGFDPHRTRSAFDRDYRRARMLVAAGWTVLFFTSKDSDADIVDAVRPFVE